MAAQARKEPAPPSASDRLASAQAALADVNRRISELVEQRGKLLLDDNDSEAIRLGSEIDALHQAAKAHEDKIRLLRAAAEQEAAERRAREREGLVTRIEDKLAARDAVGRELQDAVAAADRAFRKLIDLGNEAQQLWGWPESDIPACLLSSTAIAHALSGELYRVGGRERYGGGQAEPHGIHAGVNFPGAKPPRYELTHLREQITPFITVLQQASEHASNIMRGRRPSAQADVPVSAPASAINGVEVPHRSEAEARLAYLLRQQATLAEDVSPQGEEAYARCVHEIVEAQAAVSAESRQ
jgi:hypothetical protein